VQALSVPICIDPSCQALKGAGVASASAGESSPARRPAEAILPLIKKYDVPVIAISNDETGIPRTTALRRGQEDRRAAADYGIKAHDIVVDPLVMPIGAMGTAGRQVFTLVRRLREELKVNTSCGASNISFGLPHRHGINAAFLPMAIASGMTSAIMNPIRPGEMEAVRAANVLMGTDPNCTAWIMAYRDHQPSASGATQPTNAAAPDAGASRRRGGRDARRAGAG
jgi:5-methyltetrahydrofolate--homocysteine methyltransferase